MMKPLLVNDLRDAAAEIEAYHKLYEAIKATMDKQPGLVRRAVEQLEGKWSHETFAR